MPQPAPYTRYYQSLYRDGIPPTAPERPTSPAEEEPWTPSFVEAHKSKIVFAFFLLLLLEMIKNGVLIPLLILTVSLFLCARYGYPTLCLVFAIPVKLRGLYAQFMTRVDSPPCTTTREREVFCRQNAEAMARRKQRDNTTAPPPEPAQQREPYKPVYTSYPVPEVPVPGTAAYVAYQQDLRNQAWAARCAEGDRIREEERLHKLNVDQWGPWGMPWISYGDRPRFADFPVEARNTLCLLRQKALARLEAFKRSLLADKDLKQEQMLAQLRVYEERFFRDREQSALNEQEKLAEVWARYLQALEHSVSVQKEEITFQFDQQYHKLRAQCGMPLSWQRAQFLPTDQLEGLYEPLNLPDGYHRQLQQQQQLAPVIDFGFSPVRKSSDRGLAPAGQVAVPTAPAPFVPPPPPPPTTVNGPLPAPSSSGSVKTAKVETSAYSKRLAQREREKERQRYRND